MPFNFVKKRAVNSIVYIILILFAGLFLTSCFPQAFEEDGAAVRSRRTQIETSLTKNIFGGQTADSPFNFPQPGAVSLPNRNQIDKSYANLPLQFEPNQGRLDASVKFSSRGKGYNFFITQTETVFVLSKTPTDDNSKTPQSGALKNKKTQTEKSVVRMQFVGIDKNNKIAGTDQLPGKSNYFLGNDSAEWQTNVSQYAKIKQEGIYPGVDALYYGSQNRLEYDLTVKPGADPGKIKIKFAGTKKLSVDKHGNLVLLTGSGEIKQSQPLAYQLIDGIKHTVECRYTLLDKNKIGFELGGYDESEILTIDPVIDYSTYIGGTSDDYIKDIALDAAGNVYATGYTNSTNFPTITGSYRTTVVSAPDVIAFKLNAAGTVLIYSTYIGGSANQTGNGNDFGNSIAVDASGNAFIAGSTGSTNFPISSARQSTAGGNSDAFVLKLNSTGSTLVFSTYHGGSGEDFCNGIAVDSSGNTYLTGGTISTNFPVLNAYQSTLHTYEDPNHNILPSRDIFISKLNPAGSLVYSTYLGGDFSYLERQWRIVNSEQGNAIAVDSQGNAYVTGVTNSKAFPTLNAVSGYGFDRNTDAFVVKLNSAGNGLIFSTYLSGSDPYFYCCIDEHFSSDEGIDIAVDAAGSAYVVGNTQSGNFPVVNAYQSTNKSFDPYVINYETNPHNSLFVTKFSPDGASLIYSTYLGGSGLIGGRYYLTYCAENASSIAVDSSGSAYVTGNTCSNDFPLSNSILQSHKNLNNDWDAFVTKFSPDGSMLEHSSYFGYEGYDIGNSIAVDASGNAYVAGISLSSNIPITTSPYQSTPKGGYEGFVAKIGNSAGINITGRIKKPDGTGVGGVEIKVAGPITALTRSDGGGYYTFLNLKPNQNYIVTPVAGYYTFQPLSQTFTSLNTNVTADFTADVYQIGGRVTDTSGGVSGITVTLSGGTAAQTTETDANGYYSFEVLPGNYTVTPSKSADPVTYVFTPPNQSFSNVTSNQTANFSLERVITSETVAVADAYVQDGTSAAANFGAATALKAETDSKTGNNKNFDSYLKFDLSSINRNIKSAKLRIYASSSTTGSVATSAYSVGTVNWAESGTGGITWNNKPARSATALTGASATVTGTAFASYDIDVTNYIKSEKAAGRNIVSLALHNASSSTLFVTANSREAATDKSRLVVTTAADDNIAPSVTMTAPANGTVFTAPATVTVSASATDADGTISRVDFYNGTTPIGTSTAPASGSTYSINWSGVQSGGYVLSAIAFDDKGAQATAAPVNVTINPANNLPSVSLISPANGSTFAVGSNLGLSAAATDSDGGISKVEFFAGATLIGTATTPGSGNAYTVAWNNVAAGSYALTAKATDNAGGATTSSAVNVNVVGQTGLSPTADAYVQDGTSATTNFGTATELRTQASATAGSNRETHLKFDLSAATGITKAVLRLYGRLSDATGTNVPISVYPVSTTTWVESGTSSITWNTKPASGATAVSSAIIANNTAQWYELDLTAYVQSEKAAGRNTVAFAVKGAAVSSPYATFNSREAATNQPQLLMQTTQPRDVLLVVGSTTLNTGDNAIKTRLQNLGFTVTVKAAGSTTSTSINSTDANGKALVLVSSTVTPANVGTKLKNVPVPVLNWEFDLADDFGMTNAVSGTDFGTAAAQTQAVIVTPAHPMSAGLTSTQTLVSASSTFNWGKPNANADKIAALTTDSTKLVIYGYDAGKAMFGLEAAARRVAVYLSDTTAASLTTSGGLLFDAAVKWATQLNISPTISSLSPNAGNTGTSIVIAGTNFGASQGTGTVTFNGVAASVTNWSNTSITAVVPGAATSGFVVVTAGGVSSNGAAFSVTNSNGDGDGDGLPDAWEMQYFGNLNSGANDDPDGDGVTNLQEYLQGRNPTRGSVSNPAAVDLKVYTQLEP